MFISLGLYCCQYTGFHLYTHSKMFLDLVMFLPALFVLKNLPISVLVTLASETFQDVISGTRTGNTSISGFIVDLDGRVVISCCHAT